MATVPDDDQEIAGLLDRIHCALDMRPPECWTAAECRLVLNLLSELAATALRAELEEVGR